MSAQIGEMETPGPCRYSGGGRRNIGDVPSLEVIVVPSSAFWGDFCQIVVSPF